MKTMYVKNTYTEPLTDKLCNLAMSEWISGVGQGILTGEGTVKLSDMHWCACRDVHAWAWSSLYMGQECSTWWIYWTLKLTLSYSTASLFRQVALIHNWNETIFIFTAVRMSDIRFTTIGTMNEYSKYICELHYCLFILHHVSIKCL